MSKEMLINVSAGEECRIALLDDGRLDELYMERASAASHVGNVYKGRVMNVEASIQAAFIDFGIGRNGFLHISDLMPTYFGRNKSNVTETVGRKMARRDRPPIQHCLRRGDEIIVQVIKEGIGTKGPTLSTYLSIPGRILVMMPGVGKTGVSRKIEDEEERRRLKKILDELKPPKDVGFIIRTAGVGKTKAEIERDFKYLSRLWDNIEKASKESSGPKELYAEGDLVMRTVRDVWTPEIDRIVVDDKNTAKRIKEFFKLLMPRTKNKVEIYDEPLPLFHKYDIERDIEQMHSRTVPLKSGGYLIIDQTEAVVAIDVNSGRFRENSDAETTAFKTDLEAADEIPRQLKLRDLGGVIICDFIDLRFERHRRELEQRLAENLKKDRAKTRFLRMSEFGIIEMTRQRMRPSLKRSVFHDCTHCKGHGLVKTPESMALDVMRRLTIALHDERVRRAELSLCADVAHYVLNRKRGALTSLEEETGKRVVIKVDPSIASDEMRFELFDEREGLVWLETLGMTPPIPAGKPQQGHQRGRTQHGGRNDRQQRQDRPRELERDEIELDREGDLDDEPESSPPREGDSDHNTNDARPTAPPSSDNVAVGSAPGYSEAGDIGGGRRRRRRRGRRGRNQDDGTGQAPAPRIYSNDPGIDSVDEMDVADFDEEESNTPPQPMQSTPPDAEPVKPQAGSDEIDIDPEELQPAYIHHEMTSRGITDKGGRRRRGRGGRGRGNQSPQKLPQQPAADPNAKPGMPSLAERLRDELSRERRPPGQHVPSQTVEADDDDDDSQGNTQPATPAAPADGEQAARKRRRRRRGRGGKGNTNGTPAATGPTPTVKVASVASPDVTPTGSSDKHQFDERLPDISQYLKPITPADFEIVHDYDDDDEG